ncbi:Ribosomal protein L32e [Methanoregula boonei 6A8]|jgi:large subunit ribosomal protein L32e|uniref:Large ribosomal subunit protein eL32 n=1 Tax=Methanoregula boonei (strain DSM 21154 / JCM 14090 / 6A8) TaxID=456442 RepID=A7I5Q6_METB6|nr:50S ribosomal protein L32e [Methanoregula boonei]ABS55067.1 Ribosomal protein L32e [Methanoregula boonei 6A8]
MTTETKRLIRVRTEKGAVFKRHGFGTKPQLSDSWRKPRGQHNKQREQKKAKGNLPKPGFGSPIAVRGMHPSGFFEVLVFTEKDLENLDVKTQAIRISAGVGARKRKALQEKAAASGIKILNARVIKERVAEEKPAEPAKEAAKAKKDAKENPAKKSASKVTSSKKKGTEEKKPVKSAPSKAKPAAKETEKKAEKAEKPKAKESAKAPAKKPAAKEAEKKPATAAKKSPAEKTAPKKKSSSGVKKNE